MGHPEYSPLKYHIYLLGIEIVELFLEIAASHESVAVRVKNIEGCMHLLEYFFENILENIFLRIFFREYF